MNRVHSSPVSTATRAGTVKLFPDGFLQRRFFCLFI